MLFCSIDATKEPTEGPMLGRLVNHGERRERNAKLQVKNFEGIPALCLYALRDINKGEELLYDYGVNDLPWKKKKVKSVPNIINFENWSFSLIMDRC